MCKSICIRRRSFAKGVVLAQFSLEVVRVGSCSRRVGTENVENTTLSNERKWPTIYFQTYNMRLKKGIPV